MNQPLKAIYALVALLTMSACQTRLDSQFVDEGFFVSVQPTTSFDMISWRPKVSSSQRTVSVHPDDGGAGVGSVKLDLDGTSSAQRLGVNLTSGNGKLRFVLGLDCRFNNIYSGIDDEDDDEDWEYGDGPMRDIERQPLPWNYYSYGYAWIEPSDYNWIPYLGVEAEINNLFILGLEAGAPYGKFSYERGHYRNLVATPLEKDSWRGFGGRASGKVGLRILDNRGVVGLQYAFERYDARFAGQPTDIDAHVFSLFFSMRF